jgi:hypothetical protein
MFSVVFNRYVVRFSGSTRSLPAALPNVDDPVVVCFSVKGLLCTQDQKYVVLASNARAWDGAR